MPISDDLATPPSRRWRWGSALPRLSSPSRPRGTPVSCEDCCAKSGTAGNLPTDAHLAALAIEHVTEIVSYDRDFARYAGVRHRLPG